MFEQERVITRIQQRVLREPTIHACFLSGSYGRRSEDAFSDIDVALVYSSAAARDLAYGRRQEFVESILTFVPVKSFDAEHVRPYLHIALFANGSKADFRFEDKESIQPSPVDRDIRILKDTEGWAENHQALSRQAPLPAPATITTAELTAIDNRFWVMFWDVYRQLRRGNHIKPFPIYIELISSTLPPLLQLLPDNTPAFRNLIELLYNESTGKTIDHMRRLLEAYTAARSAIVQQHRLPFTSNQSFEREIAAFIRK